MANCIGHRGGKMGFGKEESGFSGMFLPLIIFIIVALAGMYIISNQAKPQTFYLSQEPPKNTISVQGEAKTKIPPNMVEIFVTIETNDTGSAKLAQEKNSEVTEKVKKELMAAGLKDENIETVHFSVQPIKVSRWVCAVAAETKCEQFDRIYYEETIGYGAMHEILIKYDDTKRAGAFLDAISAGGQNFARISSVSFTLKDETKKQLERDLLEKASQDAKNKAQKIATGVGVSLGKPTAVSESIRYPYYNGGYARETISGAGANQAANAEVFIGQLDVTASVSATFEVN